MPKQALLACRPAHRNAIRAAPARCGWPRIPPEREPRASPWGSMPSIGTWPRGNEFGPNQRLAGKDILAGAAAVDVFRAGYGPLRNVILGPLLDFDGLPGDQCAARDFRLGNIDRRGVSRGRLFAAFGKHLGDAQRRHQAAAQRQEKQCRVFPP